MVTPQSWWKIIPGMLILSCAFLQADHCSLLLVECEKSQEALLLVQPSAPIPPLLKKEVDTLIAHCTGLIEKDLLARTLHELSTVYSTASIDREVIIAHAVADYGLEPTERNQTIFTLTLLSTLLAVSDTHSPVRAADGSNIAALVEQIQYNFLHQATLLVHPPLQFEPPQKSYVKKEYLYLLGIITVALLVVWNRTNDSPSKADAHPSHPATVPVEAPDNHPVLAQVQPPAPHAAAPAAVPPLFQRTASLLAPIAHAAHGPSHDAVATPVQPPAVRPSGVAVVPPAHQHPFAAIPELSFDAAPPEAAPASRRARRVPWEPPAAFPLLLLDQAVPVEVARVPDTAPEERRMMVAAPLPAAAPAAVAVIPPAVARESDEVMRYRIQHVMAERRRLETALGIAPIEPTERLEALSGEGLSAYLRTENDVLRRRQTQFDEKSDGDRESSARLYDLGASFLRGAALVGAAAVQRPPDHRTFNKVYLGPAPSEAPGTVVNASLFGLAEGLLGGREPAAPAGRERRVGHRAPGDMFASAAPEAHRRR